MPTLHVVQNIADGVSLRRISFDATLAGHDHAGQFAKAGPPGLEPAYFALASSPGQPAELLVKTVGATSEALGALGIGAAVTFSEPIGRGFPLDPDDTRELVLLATGSGISGVRSVVRAEIARGLPRAVHLYYGVFTPEHRSFVEDLDAWEAAGVNVHMVYDGGVEGWAGHTGFVQDAAAADGLCRADVTVALCGFPGMVEVAKKLWGEAGAAESQLLTNY